MCMLNGRGDTNSNNFTCMNTRGRSVVDYILVSHELLPNCTAFNIKPCMKIVDEYNLQGLLGNRSRIPDHAMLTFRLNATVTVPDTDPEVNASDQGVVHRRYLYKKMKPEFMKSELCKLALVEIITMVEYIGESQEDIDRVYNNFIETVIEEMNKNIPFVDVGLKPRKFRKPKKPFWNDELQLLWKNMNQAEKEVRIAGNSKEKKEKHKLFKSKQNEFDRKFRFYERQYKQTWGNNLENQHSSNPNQFWEKINELGPKKKINIPCEVYGENDVIITETEKVLD